MTEIYKFDFSGREFFSYFCLLRLDCLFAVEWNAEILGSLSGTDDVTRQNQLISIRFGYNRLLIIDCYENIIDTSESTYKFITGKKRTFPIFISLWGIKCTVYAFATCNCVFENVGDTEICDRVENALCQLYVFDLGCFLYTNLTGI